jgi:hypothetical protein
MVVLVRIKLTKPWLGDLTPDPSGVRRFRRIGKLIKIQPALWREQFQKAAHDTHIRANLQAIKLPESMIPASIHLYTRRYSQVQTDIFESFRKGTVLQTLLHLQCDEPRAVTLDQVRVLMACIGEWHGLSPWGSKFGYGRFEVLEINDTNEPNTIQNTDLQAEGIAEGTAGGSGDWQAAGPEAGDPDGNGGAQAAA